MKILSVTLLATGAIAVAAGIFEYRIHNANMQQYIGVITPASVELRPAPIVKEWVTEGDPQTMAREIAHTDDGTAKTYIWQTTKSRFDWHYYFDEVVTITDGEVFLTDKSKVERRLGPGDVVFFPQGTVVSWRVPDHVRKIAVVKTGLPEPFAGAMRWMRLAKDYIKPSTAAASDLGK